MGGSACEDAGISFISRGSSSSSRHPRRRSCTRSSRCCCSCLLRSLESSTYNTP